LPVQNQPPNNKAYYSVCDKLKLTTTSLKKVHGEEIAAVSTPPGSKKEESGRIFFTKPMAPHSLYLDDLQQMKSLLCDQASKEQEALGHKKEAVHLPLLPSHSEPKNHFHYCRLLLSHLGFLTNENRHKFCFLTKNKRLQRSLQQLDKINGRETIKVGLIYVAEGQEDQNVILRNETKTRPFQDFVLGLGWTVDITKHRGFDGKLDRQNNTTGRYSTYWADAQKEVMFHDITAMPTKENDEQQIHKKRHVGNDNINIIWSEHKKDYDPFTIKTQFNHVHIIVYPLCNGLYRIQVRQKPNVAAFGPLQDGMVVSKAVLAPLVRTTSINAHYAVKYLNEEKGRRKKPYPLRSDIITEMYNRYRSQKTFEEYFSDLYFIENTTETETT